MQNFTTTLVALALATTAAQAQEVSFRGKVEDVSGTQNQFFLDCTGTELTSSTFDLNLFIGQMVDITGDWNGSGVAPSVHVTGIAAAPETFEIGGGAKLGETSNLSFFGAPGDAVIGFVSLAPAFVPYDADNVILLDASQVVLSLTGTVGGLGNAQLNFGIPNNNALLGLDIYGQGAIVSGGGVTLTNPDCKTIDD